MTLRLNATRDTQAQPSTLALGLGSNDTVQDICNGQGTVALRRTDFKLWHGTRDLVPLPTKAQ